MRTIRREDQPFYQKLFGAGRAMLSRRDPELGARRLEECRKCPAAEADGDKLYCRECRCPHWRMAELSVKATMTAARCPLGRWPVE